MHTNNPRLRRLLPFHALRATASVFAVHAFRAGALLIRVVIHHYNTHCGHAVGPRLLPEFGQRLITSLRLLGRPHLRVPLLVLHAGAPVSSQQQPGSMSAHQECRMYEHKFPEVDDVVMVQVRPDAGGLAGRQQRQQRPCPQ